MAAEMMDDLVDAEMDEVDRLRAALESYPLPPPIPGHRSFPVTTRLGKVMRIKGFTVQEVAKIDGSPNTRLLCEILAGRRELTIEERHGIARGLGVDYRLL